MGPKPDLESGDATIGGGPAWSEREDANEHRDAGDGEATHAVQFAAARIHPPRGGAGEPGYNLAAAFPGSSIGRASGC